MKQYEKPEYHFVRNSGGLNGDEIAKLTDAELAEYLQKCNFTEEKKKYRIKSGYILREIAGEYAIVPVDEECIITNAVMSPNDSAVFLWKVFQDPHTKEDAVRKGMEEYDVEEETIRKSTDRFVEESLKYKILEEVD
ncbi:MAG: PqqD family protein [Fusicatenibacter sp.]